MKLKKILAALLLISGASYSAWQGAAHASYINTQPRVIATPAPSGTPGPMGSIARSASSSSFTSTSTTYVPVTNLTVTLITSGRPVMLMVMPDGLTGGVGELGAIVTTAGTSAYGYFAFYRGATLLSAAYVGCGGASSASLSCVSGDTLAFIDFPTAGTYTYSLEVKALTPSEVVAESVVLVAYEM